MAIEAGAQVTPEITLVEPLGEGAMGTVWVAEHRGLGCRVAVKFVSPELTANARALARFRREAEAAAKLHNPHTVRSFEQGLSRDGVPYIAMELLAGESLGARLAREGQLDPSQACEIVQHVAASLAEAHEHGIVHRDVKADNVFLTESSEGLYAKVLDFGMAKQIVERAGSVVTATGVVVGTPEYMSPEQVLGSKELDHRTDLWALGVLAYRMMVGEMPFRGTTPHAMVFAICKAEYEPPSSFGLPAALDGWFERALAPQLDRRFASAAALARALDVALGTSLTESRPTAAAKAMEEADTLLVSASTLAAARARAEARFAARDAEPPSSGANATGPKSDPLERSGEPSDPKPPPRRHAEAAAEPLPLPASTGEATVALEQPEPPRPAARRGRTIALAAAVVAGALVWLAVAGRQSGTPSEASAPGPADEAGAEQSAPAAPADERGAARTRRARPHASDEGGPEPSAHSAIDLDSEWADGTGRVSIECVPRCDDVRIGARSLGPSPLEGVELPAGEHLLALVSADRPTTYVRVKVAEGQELRRQFPLATGPSATADATSSPGPETTAAPTAAAIETGRFEPNEL